MAERNLGRFTKVLEEPLYVAVGFGVLGFQRAQVLRRGLQRRLAGPGAAAPASAGIPGEAQAGEGFGDKLGALREAVGQTAAGVAVHLPPEARDLLRAAGDLMGDMPKEFRGIVDEAMAVSRFALHVLKAPVARRTYP